MRIWLAVLLLTLGLANAAHACGTSPPELLSRKPLRGSHLALNHGFGPRFHPEEHRRYFHTGIDWNAPKGAVVYASGDGRVINVTTYNPTRHYLAIDHGNGWITGYGELARINVAEGECVKQGQQLGLVVPMATIVRPHLHFEVIHNGRLVNPIEIPRSAKSVAPR